MKIEKIEKIEKRLRSPANLKRPIDLVVCVSART
jgi:hypothetical protein